MGGIGSGRHYRWDSKLTTDDYRSIDIRKWNKKGFISPYKIFECKWPDSYKLQIKVHQDLRCLYISHLGVIHTEIKDCYMVNLEWTNCHYGSERPWFICPVIGCNRRMAILYGGRVFACRQCYDLAYPSQRESLPYRANRRANKIKEQLGWPIEHHIECWPKLKDMHWKTYYLLRNKHNYYAQLSILEAAKRFGVELLSEHI